MIIIIITYYKLLSSYLYTHLFISIYLICGLIDLYEVVYTCNLRSATFYIKNDSD